jgi:hypothetical protein
MFQQKSGGGSWRVYLSRIAAAKGSPEFFSQPTVVHALLRAILGISGATCGLMGMRAATAADPISSSLLMGSGTLLGAMAAHLHSSLGRKIVVHITNLLAKPLGYRFSIQSGDGALEKVLLQKPQGSQYGLGCLPILNFLAWLQEILFILPPLKLI